MNAFRERRERFEAQPLAARFEAARRFSAVQQVAALQRAGKSRYAAVCVVAAKTGAGQSTIYDWLAAAEGEPLDAQLYVLCPRRGQTGLKRRNPTRRLA